MKFLRHLAAVVFAVAVIVGLGMLWAHASGDGTSIGGGPGGPAGSGSHLADTGDLIRTGVIEAVLAAVVITASAARRRHRRMWRTVAGA